MKPVSSGLPVQDIIGIGIKLTGHDASGNEMTFYGYADAVKEERGA